MSTTSTSAQINTTPLIDILLVLLIIFMVITPLDPMGLQTDLPQDRTTVTSTESSLVVQLSSDLRVSINTQPVDSADLASRLSAILAKRAERAVFVQAAPDLEFQHVAHLIDTITGAGANRVGLLVNR